MHYFFTKARIFLLICRFDFFSKRVLIVKINGENLRYVKPISRCTLQTFGGFGKNGLN